MTKLRHTNLLLATAIIAGVALAGFASAEPKDTKTKKKGADAAASVERKARPEGAGERMGPPPDGAGGVELGKFWERERLAEKLALSDEQVTQLESLVEGTKSALDSIKGSDEAPREALRAEFEKDNPDLNAVLAAQAQLDEANNERIKIILSHRVAVQTVLTQDQEKTLREGRREGMGERGGRPGARQRRGGEEGPDGEAGEGRRGGRRGGGEMRERFSNVKTLEELNAALDEAEVPAERREKIVEMWTRRQEGGAPPPPDAEMMEDGGSLPPLPPEDAE